MTSFTNTTPGARGVNLKDGTTVWIEPGATSDDIAEDDIADVHADLLGETGEAEDGDKPLSRMNKAELIEAALAEGVEIEDGATNKEIVAAIEAKRAGNPE